MHALYGRYISAFNGRDVATLERILHHAVVFEWHGLMPTLYGRDAMLAFYAEAWSHFEERLEATDVGVRGDVLRATLRTELRVFRDWPDCPIRPFFAGPPVVMSGRLQYVFHDRRINHIMELEYAPVGGEAASRSWNRSVQ